jgi:hypothetical protein
MLRSLMVAWMVIGLAGVVAAQKPHAQNHHPKAAEMAAPLLCPKQVARAKALTRR